MIESNVMVMDYPDLIDLGIKLKSEDVERITKNLKEKIKESGARYEKDKK